MLLLLFGYAAFGQSVDLSLLPQKDCDNYSYCVDIQVQSTQGSGDIQLGTSSIMLDFNPAALFLNNYQSASFSAGAVCGINVWDEQQYDAFSLPGRFNLTLSLADKAGSCPVVTELEAITIGTLCFDILQQGGNPSLAFDLQNTRFNTNQPDDGTNIISIANATSIDAGDLLACDCQGEGTPCDDQNVYTINDLFDINCQCKGEYIDFDQDGIPDGIDACLERAYEAEDADIEGVEVKNNESQYEGSGYVDYKNKVGDYVSFNVEILEAGEHSLSFRYAHNSANRYMELSINGMVLDESFDFPGTGDWHIWDVVETAYTFDPGMHTIRLTTNGSHGPNLDQLVLSFCTDCDMSGQPCDDGNPCTVEDVYDAFCNCGGIYLDTDQDGVCNTNDICEGSDDTIDSDNDGKPDGCDDCDGNLLGTACDDGNPCTEDDKYNADCNCEGVFTGEDDDNDGVCNAFDVCPGGDDSVDSDGDGMPDDCDDCDDRTIGSPCDDGDVCTILDVVTSDCGCQGIYIDSDADGVCNILDICEGYDDGADFDNDGIPDGCDPCDNALIGTPCDDYDACTINDVYDENCNCVGTFEDTDNDSVCDAEDLCEGFNDNDDADGDTTPDACDDCEDTVFQAEDATYDGPQVHSYKKGFTGSGYVDFKNSEGDLLAFDVNPDLAGNYVVTIRYANGSNHNRYLDVAVDAQIVQSQMPFPPTGSWDKWSLLYVYVNLNGNAQSIELTTSNKKHGPNVDFLSLCQTDLNQLLATISVDQHVSCNDGSDGKATVTATGGTGIYQYQWGNGETGSTVDNLTAGIHEVTVSDYLGNKHISTISITEPDPIQINHNATLSTGSDGSLDISVSGGTPGYSYLWSNGFETEDLGGLEVGSYVVTVTDNNNCGASELFSVFPSAFCVDQVVHLENETLVGASSKTYYQGFTGNGYVKTNNVPDQTISFDVNLDQAGSYLMSFRYSLHWGNDRRLELSVDGNIITELSFNKTSGWDIWQKMEYWHDFTAGNHNIKLRTTGTSSHPYLDFVSFCRMSIDPISIDWTSENVSCNGENDGQINALVTGGTGNYTYAWSNGSTTSSISELVAGDYNLTVTDDLGNSQSVTIPITQPAPLELVLKGLEPTCNGGTNGSVSATTNGGTPPVQYLWDDNSTEAFLFQKPAGTYFVTVTDANGCIKIGSYTLGEPDAIQINYTTTPETNADGTIDLDVSGGTPGYTYQWSNGFIIDDLAGLVAGDYMVTVTDAEQCTATEKITVHKIPQVEGGVANSVGENWQTITLNESYNSMVVVTTIQMPGASKLSEEMPPVVTRIKNASGNSFDLRIQNPGGNTPEIFDVYYFVAEEGSYQQENHGITFEAKKVNSGITAGYDNWVTEVRTYENTYENPAVLGQVMSFNDTRWSVFWSSKDNQTYNPPSHDRFAAGKHIAQDTFTDRLDETIGYIVFESGSYSLSDFHFEAGVSEDVVLGVQNSSEGYSIPVGLSNINGAVLSATAMDGGDGGWPVIYDPKGIDGDTVFASIEEDQIQDTERSHTSEQVAFIAFEYNAPAPLNLIVEVDNPGCENNNMGAANAVVEGGYQPVVCTWSNGMEGEAIDNLAPGAYEVTATDAQGNSATTAFDIEFDSTSFTLSIVLDNYGSETSWEMVDTNGVIAASGGPYYNGLAGVEITEELCLPRSCYEFRMYDSWGDGICCDYGDGGYELRNNLTNTILAAGGDFNYQQTHSFCDGEVEYCPSEATYAYYLWIESIEIADLTNVSGSNGGYADFTDQEITVAPGSLVPLILTPGYYGGSWYASFRIWADLNQDNDFDDPGEALFTIQAQQGPVLSDFTLPANALLGKTRLRVSMKYGYPPSACEGILHGEVEEYTLNVVSQLDAGAGERKEPEEQTADTQNDFLQNVRIFPNPVSNVLTIEADLPEQEKAELTVYDMQGKFLYQTTVFGDSESILRHQLDVNALSNGMYIIQLQSSNNWIREKFVKVGK